MARITSGSPQTGRLKADCAQRSESSADDRSGKLKKRIARLHDHRRAEQLGKLDQFLYRAGLGDAAAGDDQRALALGKHFRRFLDRFRIGGYARRTRERSAIGFFTSMESPSRLLGSG